MSTDLGYQPAAIPVDEATRLAELREYAILDTAPEGAFDDLTALASTIAGTPIALVSLVDKRPPVVQVAHRIRAV